ncbi:hypothetical protein [Rubinisphaera brasiliensis]|uniref:Uncharacterized protein n=1 Tax=Rubinisphaera brasiliensis (strain ATCC 49424 / DSM 5305 / JCM 21570 / IAM 15109 / NBRC 103401 / IFAM 1448) TaxID=756272 RepID=F0SJ80_RUBBR|nr:hypothetical protein [Rubinisphaera brasiliensis]ADY58622.1 hypothetical protein Plabr_1001 [Rubinisphaera brasiliensis DSM 5305]
MTTAPASTNYDGHASLLVAITRRSILLSMGLLAAWALVLLAGQSLMPLPEFPQKAVWLGVFLPALFGMVVSLYTTAAHPGYLPGRLTYQGPMSTAKKWLSIVACVLLAGYLVYRLLTMPAFDGVAIAQTVYWLIVLAFGLFVATRFEPQKHPLLHSLLEQTHFLGIYVIPFYLPSLLIARRRYRS